MMGSFAESQHVLAMLCIPLGEKSIRRLVYRSAKRARVVQQIGQAEDPHNFLLMHAMAPNVAGVIGSAVAAGVLLSVLGN